MTAKGKSAEYVREYNKQYYEKNKQRHTEYWEANKNEINAKRTVAVYCEACDCDVQKRGWLKHVQTIKHAQAKRYKELVDNYSPDDNRLYSRTETQ
jgi:hypothetical protein